MSLGWVIAATYVYLGELRPAERAVLVFLAEQTHRGERRCSPGKDLLMGVTGLKSWSQVHETIKSLIKRGLVKQVERARLGHNAVYELTFDERLDVYTTPDVTGELHSADRTQRAGDASGQPDPSGVDVAPPSGDGFGRPNPSRLLTDELHSAGRTDGFGQPNPSQSGDGLINQIRERSRSSSKKDLDTAIIEAIRDRTGTRITREFLPKVKRVIFQTADGKPREGIRNPTAYALKTINAEPDPRGRFLPAPEPARLKPPEPAEPGPVAPPPQRAPEDPAASDTAPLMSREETAALIAEARRQARQTREARQRPARPAPKPPDPDAKLTPDEEEQRRQAMAALEAWAAANGQPIKPQE